jgi:hypothetical protein
MTPPNVWSQMKDLRGGADAFVVGDGEGGVSENRGG